MTLKKPLEPAKKQVGISSGILLWTPVFGTVLFEKILAVLEKFPQKFVS